MKVRLSLIAAVLAIVMSHLWYDGESSSAIAGPVVASTGRTSAMNFVGAGSCAAAACHNANFARGDTGSEFTTWMTRDPHAKAYEVLFSDQSLRIQKNRRANAQAHQDLRCLQCHVSPDFNADLDTSVPYFRTDGVSCESCHGPARKWLNVHYMDSWSGKSRTEKQAEGMTDTASLLGRVQACVKCHVGTAAMDVDHDLLAAGHPRLHFEFAAFHAAMPHHWPDAKDRDPGHASRGRADFEARAWLIGQLVTTQASLELLAARAKNKDKVWPEYAEHDCAACHHNLSAQASRKPSGKRSTLPWSDYAELTPLVLSAVQMQEERPLTELLTKIQKSITNSPITDRRQIAVDAKSAATRLKHVVDSSNRASAKDIAWNDMLGTLIAHESTAGKFGTQSHLAIAALQLSHPTIPPGLVKSLTRVAQTLAPLNEEEPRAIQTRLLEWQKLGVRKGP